MKFTVEHLSRDDTSGIDPNFIDAQKYRVIVIPLE